eukprot:TRINITY_DN98986_c0_g1_i1.p1 TRINITY_DN98986_c0_g1~~TRINITY_DN98986_c0_g1_i1.p1  ORF type:complete len:352 (-),score=36.71 TRINITY_DN98986_c0_g1_i1:31-1086(-)
MQQGRCLLDLPPSALEPVVELLNSPEFFTLRRASCRALNHPVFSVMEGGQLLARLRCLVSEPARLGANLNAVLPGGKEPHLEALQRLHLPSLMVLVQRAPVKELMSVASFVSSKAHLLRNLQCLHLVAPERHHLGDTCVRMVAHAVRTFMPSLQQLGLPGINVTRIASAVLGEAVASAPRLVRLDLHGSKITPAGWLHMLRQAASADRAGRPRKRLILGVSADEPVPALREVASQTGARWEVRVLPQTGSREKVDSQPRPLPGSLHWRTFFDDESEHALQPQATCACQPASKAGRKGSCSEPPKLLRSLPLPRPFARPLMRAGRTSNAMGRRSNPALKRNCVSTPPRWPSG